MVERINIPEIIRANMSQILHNFRGYNNRLDQFNRQWNVVDGKTNSAIADHFEKVDKKFSDRITKK